MTKHKNVALDELRILAALMVLSLAALFGIEGVWWAPLAAELLVAAFSAAAIRRGRQA